MKNIKDIDREKLIIEIRKFSKEPTRLKLPNSKIEYVLIGRIVSDSLFREVLNKKSKIFKEKHKFMITKYLTLCDAYLYFVFLRSNIFENFSVNEQVYPNLYIFTEIVKSKKIRSLRNAIAHGTIEFTNKNGINLIEFTDRKYKNIINMNIFHKLMELLHDVFKEIASNQLNFFQSTTSNNE